MLRKLFCTYTDLVLRYRWVKITLPAMVRDIPLIDHLSLKM